jgi:hypothetical protein
MAWGRYSVCQSGFQCSYTFSQIFDQIDFIAIGQFNEAHFQPKLGLAAVAYVALYKRETPDDLWNLFRFRE